MPPLHSPTQPEIIAFCERCAAALPASPGHRDSISRVMQLLPDLLLNRDLLARLLEGIVRRKGYPDSRHPTMFENEFILFADPERRFSVRLYLWGPKEYLAPHDHNAWGVIGTASAGFHVVNYHRTDDGSRPDYACLEPFEELHLRAGESAYTLPLNQGIHMTCNTTDQTVTTLSVYGKPILRDHVQLFDLPSGRVTRLYAPHRRKEVLAAEALKSLLVGGI